MPRLSSDLVEILVAVLEGRLSDSAIEWSSDACVGVAMASGGYPGSYETGFPISGLDRAGETGEVFHAGTRLAEGWNAGSCDGGGAAS